MDAKTFIDKVASGNANEAKDLINDLLSSRAFESLEVKKIEIAQSLYNNGEEIEVQDTADTPMEDELLTQEEFDALSEEDQELYLEQLEQLDEVSQKTAVKAYSTRLGREDDDTGNTKSMKTMDRIHKKYGAKGVMRAATAADKAHGVHSADYTKKDFVGDYLSSKGNKVKEEVEELDELSKTTLRNYLKGSRAENQGSLGSAGHMSDKARSLGRTEQDKEDSRYEGQKLAKRKLGSPGTIPAKVMAK